MISLDVLGVNGGDIWDCDCDLTDREPREDWRLCSKTATRDRFGDFWMFNGATTALECLSMPSCSNCHSAMVMINKTDGGVSWRKRTGSLEKVVR
jgi:hypothetical protein